jgi:hypothetical protein
MFLDLKDCDDGVLLKQEISWTSLIVLIRLKKDVSEAEICHHPQLSPADRARCCHQV